MLLVLATVVVGAAAFIAISAVWFGATGGRGEGPVAFVVGAAGLALLWVLTPFFWLGETLARWRAGRRTAA